MNRLGFFLNYYGKSQKEFAEKIEAMRIKRGYTEGYKCTQMLISNLVNGKTELYTEEKLLPVLKCIADWFFCRRDKLFDNITDAEKFSRRVRRRDIFCNELKDRGYNLRERGGVAEASRVLGFEVRDYARLHQDLSDEIIDKIHDVLGVPREVFNVTLDDYQKTVEQEQHKCDSTEEQEQANPEVIDANEELLRYLNVSQNDWDKFCLLCEFMDTDPIATISEIIHNLVKDARNRISGKDEKDDGQRV